MITITQLEYIIAVDTYRHFVTASEKCFVTQPTLSMQIKKLEEQLGVTIFDRSKHPVVPTDAGYKVIEQARKVLVEAKKIETIIRDYQETISGELTIGIIPSLAPYLLPRFINSFSHNYPEVKIKVTELMTEDILDQLKKDRIDVGILVSPILEKGITEKPLFYEEMKLYVNKNHPYSVNKSIYAKAIESGGLWLLSQGHCFRSQVINLCSKVDKATEYSGFTYESGSLETLKHFVEQSGGYTVLPELAISNRGQNTAVVSIKEKPLREVSLAFSRNFAQKRLIDLLAAEINASVPQYMKDSHRGMIVEWRH